MKRREDDGDEPVPDDAQHPSVQQRDGDDRDQEDEERSPLLTSAGLAAVYR